MVGEVIYEHSKQPHPSLLAHEPLNFHRSKCAPFGCALGVPKKACRDVPNPLFSVGVITISYPSIFVSYKVLLNIEIGGQQAEEFVHLCLKMQDVSNLPENMVDAVDAEEVHDLRMKKIRSWKPHVLKQFGHLNKSEKSLHLICSAILDAMVFAGGSSVAKALFKSLATMYAHDSPKDPHLEITEHNLAPFLWEILRYFGEVPVIPYAEGTVFMQTSQSVCSTAMNREDKHHSFILQK